MEIAQTANVTRKTKIVCTLGPATETEVAIEQLLVAGMDMARINCSHGKRNDRRLLYQRVRAVADRMGLYIPIMFDLQGPKIRIGALNAPVDLAVGDEVTIRVGDELGSGLHFFTPFPSFVADVKVGDPVLIDDGRVRLLTTHNDGKKVTAIVEAGGRVTDRKGINLPNTDVSIQDMSSKDKNDLQEAVELGVDYVAISFVRTARDVECVRDLANTMGENFIHYIAKIERPEAVRNIRDIVAISEGIMVARGDLGVEVGSHRVPMIQKDVIVRANVSDRLVITATQMLDSMMERPVPTRAEASDVANAILDGTDACMLSGETATGRFPVESVTMMDKIAKETESHQLYRYQSAALGKGSVHRVPDGIGMAAYQIGEMMNARLLVAFTNSGSSALSLSKRHPDCLILGATIHEHIARRMRAYWGVVPVLINQPDSLESMFEEVKSKISERALAEDGDLVVMTAGYPMWTSGSTNLIKVMTIGDESRLRV